ncbi:hypothetical protein F7725_016449 [Dissostichus mawsoni]|uniref:Endonuclease/exonuclease/phosphatase domain-containing protein n=1 Tax=Dissostichus mawsoni TaxID=36200 RepID=A0A7J5Z253_DISMA|nr:hypothetical protein F7725_016449 [Dissostichus mawsoni]
MCVYPLLRLPLGASTLWCVCVYPWCIYPWCVYPLVHQPPWCVYPLVRLPLVHLPLVRVRLPPAASTPWCVYPLVRVRLPPGASTPWCIYPLVRVRLPPVVQELVLIPVHTKPSNAEAELNALDDEVESAREINIMILGDFNADGPHLSNEQKETLRISSAPYHWLIDDDVVT